MRTIAKRMRDHDESVIYDALKEAAPLYVAQGECMTLYAMELCGIPHEDIVKVHEEFRRILARRDILGKECKCRDLMEGMEKDHGIDIEGLQVNFPEYKDFVKEWRG